MGSGARLSFFPVNKRNKTEFLREFPLLLDWYALANIRIISLKDFNLHSNSSRNAM